jgi:hypothetical protein
MRCGAKRMVLSSPTTRRYLKHKNSSNRRFLGHGIHARLGVLGGDHKAAVVAGKAALEDLIGIANGAGVGNAKLTDKAALEGAPQPFHATFGLR